MQGPAGGRYSIKRVEWNGEVTMTNSHPDTAFPCCFPGWGTGERSTSGVLVSRGLIPGTGSPLHSCMDEVQEGRAVLAPVEAHAELAELVPIQGGLNGLQGTLHLLP